MNTQANIAENYSSEDFLCTQMGSMTYLSPRLSLSDASTIPKLIDCSRSQLENGQINLVIDLAGINQLTSKLLESFLDIQEMLASQGGWLKLANVSSCNREVLTISQVSNFVGIVDADTSQEDTDLDNREKLRLGERLVEMGVVSDAQMQEAIQIQAETGKRLGSIILEKEWATEENVYRALAVQLDVPFIDLKVGLYDPATVAELEKSIAERLKVVPLFLVRDVLTLATVDPQDMPSLREIENRLGVRVKPVVAAPQTILKILEDVHSGSDFTDELIMDIAEDFELVERQLDDYDTIDELAGGSPIVNLVNSIIQRAVNDGASDIHIEPGRDRSRVRYRIDGVLYEAMTPGVEMHPALVSRLKVMANLDISDRRLPQDGRIQVQTKGRQIDLRFSSLPGLYGEKVVLRVLDKSNSVLELNRLGMETNIVEQFKSLLSRSHGLILVTGPTGSGKTTSLYAALNHLNSMEKNLVTIEDPVEYQLEIINQNEVRSGIGLSFSKILKHVLRQDPDIVMVGEIRDRETAEIAIQAALTGHLVLSTLHTNDGIGAVTRMIDMGIEPFMLSSALLGVMAQRLLRTICPSCKTEYIAAPELCEQLGWPQDGSVRLAKGRGCPDCYDSGFKGRVGIQEIIPISEELQQLIVSNPTRGQLNDYISQRKIATLRENGLKRVLNQETTPEEVSRVVS